MQATIIINNIYYDIGDNFTDDKFCFDFTVKVCEKQQIIREKKREQVRREKDTLNILSNSGSSLFVKLYCTFQDTERLCILNITITYMNINLYTNSILGYTSLMFVLVFVVFSLTLARRFCYVIRKKR